MEYLIGSDEEFFEFTDSIRPWEKVAILTHIDLDGIASAIFLEKILEAKGHKVTSLDFLNHKKNLFFEQISKLRQDGITKIFICDIGADSDVSDFEKLRENFDVFLIDHHPVNEKLENKKNVMKTASVDCSTYCIYELGRGIFDTDEWSWLVCATMFSEFSYRSELNFEFMKNYYPNLKIEGLSSSVPGLNARKIGNALIYYKDDLKKVYDLVKEKKISELDDVSKIIEDEIDYHIENFLENSMFFADKKMYMYEIKSKYKISSPVCTIMSKFKPECSFLVFSDDGEMIKVSSRNQSKDVDMGDLMRKGISGLEGAIGGGHVAAAAARFNREDFDKFKANILN